MEDSATLAARAAQEIAASARTSPTDPGPSSDDSLVKEGLIDAINQVFALFRLNYHNQYYAAFSEEEQLRQIKKLWLESLRGFPSAQILQGAKRAVENNEYLPTLKAMRDCCIDALADLGLPSARDAYIEACNGSHAREEASWTHPCVYWSARDTGWSLLAGGAERESWPAFEASYHERCAQWLRGNPPPPVPEPSARELPLRPLDPEEARLELRRIRRACDL
ncbi:MAG: replication protein P [Pseudomonadota bacterium]